MTSRISQLFSRPPTSSSRASDFLFLAPAQRARLHSTEPLPRTSEFTRATPESTPPRVVSSIAVFAALLTLGCASRAPATGTSDTPSSSGKDAPPSAEEAAPPPSWPRGETVSFDAELSEVEAVRGLKKKRDVIGKTIATAELRRHLAANFESEVPAAARHGTEETLVALGVAPLDFDYSAAVLSLMESDLAGFYDPRLGGMFIRDELEGELRRATLAHELVHALQDQHFDLSPITRFEKDATDRVSAFACLAEGDATSAMFDGMMRGSGKTALDLPAGVIEAQMALASAAEPEDHRVPAILRRSLIAPYADGLRFVHELRRRGGFEEVNRAFAKPPTSTEQVLHIEKYLVDEPRDVALPSAPPGDGWKLTFHDVWGEQSVRLLLEEWLPRPTSAAAAAGWGGDRLALFERGHEHALVWVIEMDDAREAEELTTALRRGAAARGGRAAHASPPPLGAPACTARTDLGPFVVAWDGKTRVVLTSGPYDRAAAQAEPHAEKSATDERARRDCHAMSPWVATLLAP